MPDPNNSKIIIANKALSHIKQRTITSLDENSEQARKVNLFYDCVRRAALRSCDWRFATQKPILALLGDIQTAADNPTDQSKQDIIPQWMYTYAYPSKCIRVRKVFNPQVFVDISPYNDRSIIDRSARIHLYEVCRSPITNQMAIGCNLPFASCEITADITDESQFDDLFQDSMAWLLAQELAVPLSCDQELKDSVDRDCKAVFDEAKRKNGGEGTEVAPRYSNFEMARNGYDAPF